jgi:RNA polymerase sigma-70 factor (ECF subfamily)
VTPRPAVSARPDDVDFSRDRVLVERCQGGDASAFDDLYLRYYARLVRFCRRRLDDPVEAEDAAQEAFARAWRAMPSFDGDKRFYPWLSVIASNLCVDIVRRSKRMTPLEDTRLHLAAQPVDGGQEALVEARDDRELIAKALARVSPRYREVLQLREGNEWSYQQIANHKGVQVSTIETLLYRARRSLKREYLLLSDGRLGVAGLIAALGKLFAGLRPRGLKAKATAVKVPGTSVAPAGAQVVGISAPAATVTGTGVGVATAAAVATVVAVGTLAVVASLLPHGARAGTPAADRNRTTTVVAAVGGHRQPATTAASTLGPSSSKPRVGAPAGRPGKVSRLATHRRVAVPVAPGLASASEAISTSLPQVPVAPPRTLGTPVATINQVTIPAGVERALTSADRLIPVPPAQPASIASKVPVPKVPVTTPTIPVSVPVPVTTPDPLG